MFVLQNFFLFSVYSFIGWVAETIYCLIIDRKYVNRGFLNGPFCPIYGFGAVLVLNLLEKYSDDLVALFVMSMAVTGFVEYVTSFVLEKAFNISLWNYSEHKFNLNGRICLWNLILFGIMSIALVHLINPFVMSVLEKVPKWTYNITLIIMVPYFITDLIIASRALTQIREIATSHMLDLSSLTAVRDDVATGFRTELEELKDQKIKNLHKRLLRAFPNMETLGLPIAIKKLREDIKNGIKNELSKK